MRSMSLRLLMSVLVELGLGAAVPAQVAWRATSAGCAAGRALGGALVTGVTPCIMTLLLDLSNMHDTPLHGLCQRARGGSARIASL